MTTDSETIQYLTIQCEGITSTPTLNGQGDPCLKSMAHGVKIHDLMNELLNHIGVNGILIHIPAADIATYQKGGDNE